MSNLDVEQLETLLSGLNGWQVQDGKLHKVFEFQDFAEAFAFMTRVALVAEKADHHPDWSNSYRKVVIDLVTHSTGGITQKDIDLARTIDAFS
ncbi:MAG: 4a-hydroxytetrahydrobiopterin dehydratase [Thiolinea sp.]